MDPSQAAAIDVVEASYNLEVAPAEWLPNLLEGGESMLDFGLGYYGIISAGVSEQGVPVLTQVHAGPGGGGATDQGHARGALRKRDPEEALRLWQGLIRGRWTLIDWFDTDGRRFVLWGSDAGPIRGVDVSGRSRSRDRSFFLAFWAWSRTGKSISAGFISWRGTSLMRIMRR